jgi:tRNA G37 N-methylase TrmD
MSGIALDTNLLLLLVVGQATGGAAGKRLKNFTDEDFVLLCDCIEGHDRLVATSNVWTEVSNIWDFGMEAGWRRSVATTLAETIKAAVEIILASQDVVDDPEFQRLGVADCVWLKVLDQNTTLLTDDVVLCNVAMSRGLRAVNFTHLRDFE